MSENRAMFVEGAGRLFRDLNESKSEDFATLWPTIEEMGFPTLLVPEAAGGVGGDLGDAFAVVKLAGRFVLPLPLAEAMIGQFACARAGEPVDDGLVLVAARSTGQVEDGRFTGTLRTVPWGRHAARILVSDGGEDFLVSVADAIAIRQGENPAGEPRDTLDFAGAAVVPVPGISGFRLGALLRTAQIAGALEGALDLSVGYANDRVQFGRSIGKFQVIQHNLAMFAEEAAAATAAGQAAAIAADVSDADFEIAAAKCRANKAAAFGQATAHAVHGAIGFTREHALNHLTRRLLVWRSEFGTQEYWNDWLGRRAIEMGKTGFWATLTARSDAIGKLAAGR